MRGEMETEKCVECGQSPECPVTPCNPASPWLSKAGRCRSCFSRRVAHRVEPWQAITHQRHWRDAQTGRYVRRDA